MTQAVKSLGVFKEYLQKKRKKKSAIPKTKPKKYSNYTTEI